MKNLFFLLILVLNLSCSREKEINTNFRNILIDYQSKYPIPKENHERGKRIYLYIANFSVINKDTLITITRSSSGITETTRGYGIYQKDGLLPTFVVDNKNVGERFLLRKNNNNIDKYYWKSDVFPESFPPLYTYKVIDEKFKLVKIDTIWNNWD